MSLSSFLYRLALAQKKSRQPRMIPKTLCVVARVLRNFFLKWRFSKLIRMSVLSMRVKMLVIKIAPPIAERQRGRVSISTSIISLL